ncbi:DUF1127 domain-containing protein [Salipiger abyssi]|uniref:DUF1127 domain-containing protein n=1 Tax=Salipiger abyssi TaxID=1250539 RepID=UPI001A8E40C3|nr:DUF1127 domain-containing protein [Salipiger abyssi]MBN9887327.1 DUF1127 domain-containing protein [Salipiger abyssi]
MAYATEQTSRSQSGLTGRFADLAAGLREHLARRRLYKETFRELAALSNRELGDLGLNRSMIRRIAWQAAYGA